MALPLTRDSFLQFDLADAEAGSSFSARLEKFFVFIALLGYSNLFVFMAVGAPAENPTQIIVDPGPLARASWYPIYLSLLGLSCVRWRALLMAIPRLWPVILLFLIAAASTQWSIDPALTQRRVVALFFTMLFGAYLAVRGPLIETLRLMGYVLLVLGLVNLLISVALPAIGRHSEIHVGAWRGFMGTKNLMGGEMSRANAVFGALLFYDRKHRSKWLFGFALSLLLVLGSTSKTSLLAMAAPWALFIAYYIAARSIVLGLFSLWGSVVAVSVAYVFLTFFPDQLVALIGRDLTFTGRTEIWALALHLIESVKWTGYGYAAFWVDPLGPARMISDTLQWEVPTAHNGWLEVGLSMGYPGITALAVMTGIALVKAIGISFGRHGPWVAIFIVQMMIFSFSESLLLEQNTYATMFFTFMVSYALVARKVPNTPTPVRPNRRTRDSRPQLPRRID